MADKKDIAKIVAIISAAYPNFNISEFTVEVYYRTLKDIPPELLEVATMKSISEPDRKFAPSVGEVRGAVLGIYRRAENLPTALEAWDEVCRADEPRLIPLWKDGKLIEEIPFVWSHSLVGKVARMFGFPYFPKVKNGAFENEALDRAHFIKQYDSELQNLLTQKIELPEVAAYLEGSSLLKIGTGEKVMQLTERMKI